MGEIEDKNKLLFMYILEYLYDFVRTYFIKNSR